jgi:hypothetical protein
MFVWAFGYILSPLAAVVAEKCGEEIDPIPEMERLRLVERGFCNRKNPRQRIVDVISRLHSQSLNRTGC